MIEYNPRNWFQHIVAFRKADTLRILFPEMVMVALYAAGVTGLQAFLMAKASSPENAKEITRALQNVTVVHSLLGFALSLLVVFRTNTAYDRWWEGRKLWGSLVNISRNLAFKFNALLPPASIEDRRFFRVQIADFARALAEHLRGSAQQVDYSSNPINAKFTNWEHVPNSIIQRMYVRSKQLVDQEKLTAEEMIFVDSDLRSFADVLGGCERILKTPIPFTYNLFLKKFIFFYIVTLPLGLAAYFGYWSIPLTVFVFYVLVSLEYIAEEIEDPFGTDANDLPTDLIADTIGRNVAEILTSES